VLTVSFPYPRNRLTEGEQNSKFRSCHSPQGAAVCAATGKQGLVLGHPGRGCAFSRRASRWTNTDWLARNRVSFSNDPFTQARCGWNGRERGGRQEENGDTVDPRQRATLIFEDRLCRVPVASSRRKIQQNRRWKPLGCSVSRREEPRRAFRSPRLRPIRESMTGTLQPGTQFLLGACRPGQTTLPAATGLFGGGAFRLFEQDAQLGDLFGWRPSSTALTWAFDAEYHLDLSSFNPEKHRQRHAQLGEIERPFEATAAGLTRWHAWFWPPIAFGCWTAPS